MSDVFDPAFLEPLLRADLAALADPEAVAEVGLDELAYVAFERAGMLRRVTAVPADAERALAGEHLVAAALDFLSELALDDRLDDLLESARDAEPAEAGEPDPVEAPEHLDLAETLFLHRDRVQAALGEIARALPAGREIRAKLARVIATLHGFDERLRDHLHELFPAIPLIEALKTHFDWRKLDRDAFWWWTEVDEAFRALEAAPPGPEALAERAADGEAGPTAPVRGRRPAREALRLAAAPTAEEERERLRARLYRPKRPIPGTHFSFTAGVKEGERIRFTFHEEGVPGRTRTLDGSEVVVAGVGSASVENGAAEVPLPRDRPPADAAADAILAQRTLRRPDGSTLELP